MSKFRSTHDPILPEHKEQAQRRQLEVEARKANANLQYGLINSLEHGFPIASGVIEGACHCLVKERKRSGMRWTLDGTLAMLGSRSIRLSGMWEQFTQFRIQRESQRLYPVTAANGADFAIPISV